MKSLVFVIAIFAGFILGAASTTTPSDELIDALIAVESNGDASAIGDGGRAVGCLQIWECVVIDVNEVSDTKYTYEDRKSKSKSIEICREYLKRYGKAYQKATGKTPTNEVFARIWNGGPTGYKKSATIKYWNKVKKHLNGEVK